MKLVVPLLFLIALIALVALSVRHFIAKLRNLVEVFSTSRVPPDVSLGICDGSGIVQLYRVSSTWGYVWLNQTRFSDIKLEEFGATRP